MSKPVLESDLDAFEREEKERALEIRSTARSRHQEELRERSRRNLKQSWPLAAGIVLAFLAPLLLDLADLFAPWGTWILLPAVSLVDLKQLLLNSEVRTIARQFALYGQFPIEAVFIRSVLKGRVSFSAVAGQLALLHSLAVVFLWLLSSSAAQ